MLNGLPQERLALLRLRPFPTQSNDGMDASLGDNLPLASSHVTSDKLLSLSEPQYLHL